MRKKKFSKERFYRRLEAQNKKAVPQPATDWDVMQSGYSDCLIYPDFFSDMALQLIREPLFSKRHGLRSQYGGFTGAVIVDDQLMPDGGRYVSKEIAEKIGADGLFFNAHNSAKQPEPKPEFVPPLQPIKIETSKPNNDSGLFGLCFLHMAAIVACALLLCGILQKLSH